MESFTGDRVVYTEIRNFIYEKGFSILDAIHVGDNKYEFEETRANMKLGCHNLHKILAWKEGNEIMYRTKVVGSYCSDLFSAKKNRKSLVD